MQLHRQKILRVLFIGGWKPVETGRVNMARGIPGWQRQGRLWTWSAARKSSRFEKLCGARSSLTNSGKIPDVSCICMLIKVGTSLTHIGWSNAGTITLSWQVHQTSGSYYSIFISQLCTPQSACDHYFLALSCAIGIFTICVRHFRAFCQWHTLRVKWKSGVRKKYWVSSFSP